MSVELLFSVLTSDIAKRLIDSTITSKNYKSNLKNTNKLPKEIVDYPSYAVDNFLSTEYGINPSFLNALSQTPYESNKCKGTIIVSSTGQHIGIVFHNPIKFCSDNSRQIRKFLHMCNEEQAIIAKYIDSQLYIIGFGKTEIIDLQITFEDELKWIVDIHNQELSEIKNIKYSRGKYYYSNTDSVVSIDRFLLALRLTFNISDDATIDRWKEIYSNALLQKHGTLLVISDDAHNEIDRLSNAGQGIKIEKKVVKGKSMILGITAIDGAVMFGTNGVCYGIGVILDSRATAKGNPERGARFNSAINYVAGKKDKIPCMAIIISEDKTVEIVDTESYDFEYLEK